MRRSRCRSSGNWRIARSPRTKRGPARDMKRQNFSWQAMGPPHYNQSLNQSLLGGIEAGGTKFVCGVGTGPGDLETIQIHTTSPEATTSAAVEFLGKRSLQAVGIASFGPG